MEHVLETATEGDPESVCVGLRDASQWRQLRDQDPVASRIADHRCAVWTLDKTSQGNAIETFGLKIAGLADSAFVEVFHHKELLYQSIEFDKKIQPWSEVNAAFCSWMRFGLWVFFFRNEIYPVTANEQPSQLFRFRGRTA